MGLVVGAGTKLLKLYFLETALEAGCLPIYQVKFILSNNVK